MRDFFRRNVYRQPQRSLPPERYVTMNAHHLRELHQQGHRVMPHTHSHASLAEICDADAVERELEVPRRMIEDLLQAAAPAFAFPFGTHRDVSRFAYQAMA